MDPYIIAFGSTLGIVLDIIFIVKVLQKNNWGGLKNFIITLGSLIVFGVLIFCLINSACILLSGNISITSEPSNAAISIDGEYYGQTPMTFSLIFGNHLIKVESEKYESWQDEIEVKPQETFIKDITLTPKCGTLNLKTTPDDVMIYIGNQLISPTANVQNLSLPIGNYSLQLVKAGYITKSMSITIKYNSITTVVCHLLPQTGTITIKSTPNYANVYIDDVFAGITPLKCNDLVVGIHTVNVSKDGFIPVIRQLVVQHGVTTNSVFTLDSAVGYLSLLSSPTGATIEIDDKFVGYTPLSNYTLSIGTHDVVLSKVGYQTMSDILIISSDKSLERNYVLSSIFGSINISTIPDNMNVYMNNNLIGTTPLLKDDVIPGTYKINIGDLPNDTYGTSVMVAIIPSYKNWEEVLTINSGESINLNLDLSIKSSRPIVVLL